MLIKKCLDTWQHVETVRGFCLGLGCPQKQTSKLGPGCQKVILEMVLGSLVNKWGRERRKEEKPTKNAVMSGLPLRPVRLNPGGDR